MKRPFVLELVWGRPLSFTTTTAMAVSAAATSAEGAQTAMCLRALSEGRASGPALVVLVRCRYLVLTQISEFGLSVARLLVFAYGPVFFLPLRK